MIPDEFSEIKERCDKATSGPWEFQFYANESYPDEINPKFRARPCQLVMNGDYNPKHEHLISCHSLIRPSVLADGDFIAHARQDIPHLLDAIEASYRREQESERVIRELCILATEMNNSSSGICPLDKDWKCETSGSDACTPCILKYAIKKAKERTNG